jgi:tRNA 2-thiouridine synthesizing protein E
VISSADQLDKEGFLVSLNAWDESVAEHIAAQEGISLSEAHWEMLWLVREYYQNFELSPAMRPLCQFIKQRLGPEKATSIYLLRLFPGSPAKLASKIAGLPKPDNCL